LEGAARCPLCSQNAHEQNVLAWASDASRRVEGRSGEKVAQLRATLAAPLKNDEESSKGYAR
jgi:hypothetical protein